MNQCRDPQQHDFSWFVYDIHKKYRGFHKKVNEYRYLSHPFWNDWNFRLCLLSILWLKLDFSSKKELLGKRCSEAQLHCIFELTRLTWSKSNRMNRLKKWLASTYFKSRIVYLYLQNCYCHVGEISQARTLCYLWSTW